MSTYNAPISWGKTLWVNLIRSFCAAAVWSVFLGISGDPDTAVSMLLLPVLYFSIFMPLGLLVRAVPGVPLLGIFNLMAALTILPGDPLLFVLNRMFPQAIPVHNYPFIHFALIVFVTE